MAATPKSIVTVHERSRIAPRGDTPERSLPLTYLDMGYVHFPPSQRLLLYEFPHSTSHFYETVVPNLKSSLSQALGHYSPLAGNLYFPLADSGLPELRYVPGDSVSFIVAESTSEDLDFNYMTEYKARDADLFFAFVPDKLSDPDNNTESSTTDESGNYKRISSLMSVQVTLFPGKGICIGFANHHVVGDASSTVGFIKAWSAIARFGSEDVDEKPFYDRSVIVDPKQRRANIFWNQIKNFRKVPHRAPQILSSNIKVRETFVMLKNDIQSLRNRVLARKASLSGNLNHLSSYTISTAYVWSCLAKTASKIEEEVNDNDPEHYSIVADLRKRLDPPVPAEYFGNCLGFAFTESTHGELKSLGDNGFLNAVEAVSTLITEKVNNKMELLKDADDWLVKYGPLIDKRILRVGGSPRYHLYDTDFGWGKPKKYELLSLRGDSTMWLCKSREFDGGLEIGLCMPKNKMEAFEGIFYGGLKM